MEIQDIKSKLSIQAVPVRRRLFLSHKKQSDVELRFHLRSSVTQNLFCVDLATFRTNHMPTGYQIYNQSVFHYLVLQVVDWVDVFTRKRIS